MSESKKWHEELELLKSIFEKAGLSKTIKWGTEVYTHNGRNVVACLGFKEFFSLWFYDGVFLSDSYKVLYTASNGETKALRQWRFTSIEEIDEDKIMAYIQESIANVEKGKVWKKEKSKPLEVPELLKSAFEENPALETAFFGLTPFKQKEYIQHINSARREETKITRLDKMIPMILQNEGLHDKHRK